MAKVVKDTREVIDVDEELAKIKKEEKTQKKVDSKDSKKKPQKKSVKSKKTNKKKHSKVVTFFKEVKSEMSKVKWPSKKDMVKYSIATIIFIVFFAVFFYLIDLIIAIPFTLAILAFTMVEAPRKWRLVSAFFGTIATMGWLCLFKYSITTALRMPTLTLVLLVLTDIVSIYLANVMCQKAEKNQQLPPSQAKLFEVEGNSQTSSTPSLKV